MIRALLVDLDDTLIENDVARFVPAYLKRLTADLADFADPETVAAALQAGTQAMLANEDAEHTLLDVFLGTFSPRIGATEADVYRRIRRFYAETYPQLASLTRPKAGAAELVAAASQRGWAIAVATNPLLTRHAVEQRLAWAGVPEGGVDYALVASVESFHFAKPKPAFYAEVLAQLRLLPSEAVMIGNDPQEDLLPSAALGLPVFQIDGPPQATWPVGALDQARQWLEGLADPRSEQTGTPSPLIARLQGQMATLLGRFAGRSAADLRTRPADGGLTLLETLCHLRDVDREVNLPRIDLFLRSDDPFLSAVNTDEWIASRSYNDEDPEQARRQYVEGRRTVLARLAGLSDAEWQRPGRHSLLGPLTLADWVAVMTEHDLRHLPPPAQIERRE
jgi:FMN phosphatase YigB (HAD superfamily)